MKSPLAALSTLAAATLALTGCGATQSSSSSTASATSSQAASGKIEVFAAASLNNAGADLEKAYEAANPGVDVTFVYEGSAKLVNQIEQGATPDLLITARHQEHGQGEEARPVLRLQDRRPRHQ